MGPSPLIALEQRGQLISRAFSNAAGTLRYNLYVPQCILGKPMPLVVMLHGCTQDPEDFAAGTRMNEWAEKEGLFVVYPAQSVNANGAKCWNWFDPTHQLTDSGEPSLIAGIAREVASLYPVDTQRIFVAGLSAGAAMAVILGATYPDLFAAVGAHSGLPYRAAHNVFSAFAAMRGWAGSDNGSSGSRVPKARGVPAYAPPTIVFHGDRDATVSSVNGAAIVSQTLALKSQLGTALIKTIAERMATNGGECTTTFYHDSTRRPHIEQWELHGAGHAWSGGSPHGSYTDVTGPDATAEMLRFFLAQKKSDQVPAHLQTLG